MMHQPLQKRHPLMLLPQLLLMAWGLVLSTAWPKTFLFCVWGMLLLIALGSLLLIKQQRTVGIACYWLNITSVVALDMVLTHNLVTRDSAFGSDLLMWIFLETSWIGRVGSWMVIVSTGVSILISLVTLPPLFISSWRDHRSLFQFPSWRCKNVVVIVVSLCGMFFIEYALISWFSAMSLDPLNQMVLRPLEPCPDVFAPVDMYFRPNPTTASPSSEVFIPATLEEALDELQSGLSPEIQQTMKELPEACMIKFYLPLGMSLTTTWKLWGDSSLALYFREHGIDLPDDMLGIIFRSFWRRLNKEPIRFEQQVRIIQRSYRRKEREKMYWQHIEEERLRRKGY